jgi:hypothetical protein
VDPAYVPLLYDPDEEKNSSQATSFGSGKLEAVESDRAVLIPDHESSSPEGQTYRTLN